MTFALELARRANAVSLDRLGPEAAHVARRAVADTLGVALAGCDSDYLATLETTLGAGGADQGATLVGRGRRASMLHAALINATAAHALDFDDCSTTMGGHPSVPVIPVVLAMAEKMGLSADAALDAYAAGFETETRIARGVLPHHYEKGWHPTATLGIFGATVAAGRLFGLDDARMANALALAVSMAGGLKSNFGTPVKPLQVGQAAHNGLLAATMTLQGIDANPAAFEHTYGFFNLFNGPGTFDADAILADWDGVPEILRPGIAIKQHPCCGSAHSAIDAAIAIRREHGPFTAGHIARIETWTHERRLAHTNRPMPRTAIDAKFSVQFLTVKGLMTGIIRLGDFEDGFLTDEMTDLLGRTASAGHQEADQYLGRVRVTLTDGQSFEARASTNFGRGPLNPMSDDELADKFIDCAKTRLSADAARAAFDAILAMRSAEDLRAVMARVA